MIEISPRRCFYFCVFFFFFLWTNINNDCSTYIPLQSLTLELLLFTFVFITFGHIFITVDAIAPLLLQVFVGS